jgi:hypothetical protein
MFEGGVGRQVGELALAIAELERGNTLDPDVLAARFGWETAEALVVLQMAQEAGVGKVRLRVIGPDGAEVARYDDLASIPAEVEDDFGQRVYVTPEKVELIFEVASR